MYVEMENREEKFRTWEPENENRGTGKSYLI